MSFGGSGPFLKIAPKLSLPMRHFAFAACAFWLFAAAFVWGNSRFLDFNFAAFWVLGLVHTLTLGWVAMTIFGALTQMIPVHGEIPLKSPMAVAAAWWCFAAGILGFVGFLWRGIEFYWLPACLLLAGVCLYLYAFGGTLIATKKRDWTALHIAFGLFYLSCLAIMGLLLAYDRESGILFRDLDGALIAHVHLALIGWVSLTIFGASYRLVSFISLARLESKIPSRLAFALTNIGLIGLAVDALFFRHRWIQFWAVLLVAGYCFYAFQARPLLKKSFAEIDPSLAFTGLALIGGSVWAVLGLSLAFGTIRDTTEIREAYVFAALLGWVTPYIMGQILKIAPFLIWLHVYCPKDWTPPMRIPKIDDLTSKKIAWAQFAAFAPAVFFGLAGFLFSSQNLLRLSSWLMFAAATLYVANTAVTLCHLLRRNSKWSSPAA